MKIKLKLTDSRVRGLTVGGREYVAWDNQLFGFGVRVRPTGYKAFILHGLVRGKIHKVTLGRFPVMSEEKARQACVEVLTRLQTGEETPCARSPDTPRFDEFTSGIWKEQKFARLKPTGQRSTLSYINSRLLPAFGRMYLGEINRPGVAAWFEDYSQTYPGGANRSLEILMSILEFAIVCGHMKDNPAKGIKKNPKKVLNRFLSAEEIKTVSTLLNKAEKESCDYKQAADITRLLLLTGCRHREITLLEWSMVKGDVIKLPDTKTGPREVYLSKKALTILERQPKNGSRWVFPWVKDPARPRDDIGVFWRDIRERVGITDVRVHDLRHTFASHAIIKGVTVPMVSKLLGHRKTAMTLRYTHVSDKDTQDAAERVGVILQGLLRGEKISPDRRRRTSGEDQGIVKRGKGALLMEKPEHGTAKRPVTVSFSLRVSEAEYAAIAARVKADGSGICAWLRRKLDNPPEKLPLPDTRQVSRKKCIGFRTTKEQMNHYAKTAEAAGQSVAWWARAVLLDDNKARK